MRSVFNEAQSDDTLRQVGGVFYTDRYCALIFTYLLRSAAPDDRASTRAHRTEPFHLIFHLNFRSTSKTCAPYTDNCFPTNTRTSSCAGSTRSAGFPSFHYVLRIMNVSARCIRSLVCSILHPFAMHQRRDGWFIRLYVVYDSETFSFRKIRCEALANQRKKSILREMLSGYLDRFLNWFRDVRTTPSVEESNALTLICRHPFAFLLSITHLRFLLLRGLLSQWISF